MVMQLFSKGSEVKLVEALNSVSDPSGWYAVHFHLSDLMEQFRSEYQIKITVNLINDLLKNFDGGIFVMQDTSIIVVCYGLEKALQNKLIFQLRYLYMDDPLAYTEDGQENSAFCTSYDLKKDWQSFMDLSTRRMAMTVRRTATPREQRIEEQLVAHQEPVAAPVSAYKTKEADSVFSAARLAGLEHELMTVSLDHIARRQTVCAVQFGLPPKKVFDELYVHIAQLRESLKANVDFLSNRWLFRYLTQLLDVKMLQHVQKETAQFMASPVSLNLHVETLLSSAFHAFDQSLPAGSKAGIVLEVPVVDAFADMTGFQLARKEMQKLGYRICLDGVTSDSLNHIRRERLGVDLVKVQWNMNLSEAGSDEQKDMMEAVKVTGAKRIILCRCDNKTAIDFGHSVGIALFQGRYVDSLINPSNGMDN